VGHPIFKTPQPAEHLEELVEAFLADRTSDNRNKIVLKLFPVLQHLIGRFLLNWPVTQQFEEDIINEGAFNLCLAIDLLTEDRVDQLISFVASTIQKGIESYMNNMQSVSAPRLQKNYKQRRETGNAIYHVSVTNNVNNLARYNYDIDLVDALEAIESLLVTKDEREYFESLLIGGEVNETSTKKLQKRFENFLRDLLDD